MPVGSDPMARSIQPVRIEVPRAARSSSSWAVKCERDFEGWPTAVTKPRVPLSHKGFSGASAGCRPNIESSLIACDAGMAIVGRAA